MSDCHGNGESQRMAENRGKNNAQATVMETVNGGELRKNNAQVTAMETENGGEQWRMVENDGKSRNDIA